MNPDDAFLEALSTLQQQSEHHRLAVEELRKLFHRPPAQASRFLIKSAEPQREVDIGRSGVKSVALLNFSPVTAYLGIAGRSAAQGNGLAIPALSYLVLPIATNVLDVGIDPATAPAAGADIMVLKYDHVQELSAGNLTSASQPGTLSRGYQQLASLAAANTIASLCAGGALPTGATRALIVPSATVRIRDDGVAPTAAVGMPIAANQPFTYDGDKLAALQVYGAATLDVWFYS